MLAFKKYSIACSFYFCKFSNGKVKIEYKIYFSETKWKEEVFIFVHLFGSL
jgi:hypothetical protein